MKFYGTDLALGEKARSLPDALGAAEVSDLIEALPDGVALVSLDGRIRFVNRAFERLADVSSQEIVGQSIAAQAVAGGGLAPLGASLNRAKPLDAGCRLGSGRLVSASLRILRDAGGDAYGGLVLLRDGADFAEAGERRPERFRFRGDGLDSLPLLVEAPYLDELLRQGAAALGRNARVMLTGESGTGKTALALRLRDRVSGTGSPFVHVNCGSIPDSLFESEMFGYEAGAFTGAASRGKAGYVEAADGGVLFLDEVGEIPLPVQAKLLTFLEDGSYLRIGSAARRRVRVKIVSATNRSLLDMIEEGRFRRDLYYRLAVVTLHLPALRDKAEMIEKLVDRHLARINADRTPPLALSPAFREAVLGHDYPGNIRELGNILEHAAATADAVADVEHLPDGLAGGEPVDVAGRDNAVEIAEPGDRPLKDMVRLFEDFVLEKAIAKHGSKRRAAKALGIDIGTLVRKTKRV